jgi:hypothetical protein
MTLVIASTVGLAIWFAANLMKQPPKLLMRHFQVADLGMVFDGAPADTLKPYDVFVYGHTGLYEKTVSDLVAKGENGYRYYQVLTMPLSEWIGGDNVWFNWLDITIRGWDAILTDTLGTEVVFGAFGNPAIIDWSELGPDRYSQIIDQQMATKGACKNMHLDQFWFEPADWMIDKDLGPAFSAVDPKKAELWKRNITNYLLSLRKVISAQNGLVLTNGDRSAPQPMFIENAHWVHMWPWQSSVDLWRKHRQNVLSVDPGQYEDSLIVVWLKHGGTISMTGEGFSDDQRFYERASKSRELGMLVKQ